MLKVCFCAKQVDGLMTSRQILTSKKDSIKPPIDQFNNNNNNNKNKIKIIIIYYFI
jgi:hypothetical protein